MPLPSGIVVDNKKLWEEFLKNRQKKPAQKEVQAPPALNYDSQLEDMRLRRQAEIYRDVNKPQGAVLPDKLKHALQLLSEKKRALLKLPYPVYQGDMKVRRAPASELAEGLRERYAQRGRPYTSLMEELGNHSPTREIGRQRSLQDALLEQLLQKQSAFAEKQGNAYGLNQDRILEDLSRLRTLSSEKLLPLAEEGANQAFDRRGQLSGLLKGLQEQKTGRRQNRMDELKKLGHLQKYREKKEKEAGKKEYEEQARYPWKQAMRFEEEIKPLMGVNNQSPPEMQKYAGDMMDIAQNALNQPYTPYQGKRVANFPEGVMKAQGFSQKLMGSGLSLKPSLNKIMGRERDEGVLLNYINPYIDRQSSDLERQAEETLRKQKQSLDAKYIRLGQYGGSQHRLEQEQMARDMLKNLAQRQHSLLGEGYQRGLAALHGEQMRRTQNLALRGEAKEQKFRENLDAMQGYRRDGTKNFLKEQKGLNAAYEDFKQQREAIWPHRRREIMMSPQQMPMGERRAK